MDIEAMVRDGKNYGAIMSAVQAEINAANAKMKAEVTKKEQEKELDAKRMAVIDSVLDYAEELGLLPAEMREEIEADKDDLVEIFKEVEKEFESKIAMMKLLASLTKEKKPKEDEILRDFLKGLK